MGEQAEPAGTGPDATYVEAVTRYCVIDPRDGIAVLEITLERARLFGPVVLAHIAKPFSAIRGEDEAVVSLPGATKAQSPHEVAAKVAMEVTPLGRRIELVPREPGRVLTYSWSCLISAGCPLTERDRELMRGDSRFARAAKGLVFRPFRVRFPCGQLTLIVEITRRGDRPLPVTDVCALTLQSGMGAKGFARWTIVDQTPLEATTTDDGNIEFRKTFPKPAPSLRYAIGYRLQQDGLQEAEGGADMTQRVLQECRGSIHASPSALERRLTSELFKAIQEGISGGSNGEATRPAADDTEAAPPICLLGLLWNPGKVSPSASTTGRLVSGFGHFKRDLWGLTYEYGCGMPGHAFRTGQTLAYSENTKGDTQTLLYESDADAAVCLPVTQPAWELCVPIQPLRGSMPIGVISISPIIGETALERQLGSLARCGDLERLNEEARRKAAQAFQRLAASVNIAFWSTLGAHLMPENVHDAILCDYAQRFLNDWLKTPLAAQHRSNWLLSPRQRPSRVSDESDPGSATSPPNAPASDAADAGLSTVRATQAELNRANTWNKHVSTMYKVCGLVAALGVVWGLAASGHWQEIPERIVRLSGVPKAVTEVIPLQLVEPAPLTAPPSLECLRSTDCLERRSKQIGDVLARTPPVLSGLFLQGLAFDSALRARLHQALFEDTVCPDGERVSGPGACDLHWGHDERVKTERP